MNITFDIGNTAIKWATFAEHKPIASGSWIGRDGIPDEVAQMMATSDAMIASASGKIPSGLEDIPLLDADSPLPIKIAYRTPSTLGADRLAGACGAKALFPGNDCLVIDAGTCITVDFISADGTYHGGAIMPGLQMNLHSLHTFTAKLPLISIDGIDHAPLLGRTTEESILAGTLGASLLAIAGFIAAYRQKCPALQVVLTGGDAELLSQGGTAGWHIEPMLNMIGLNEILMTLTGK